MGQDMLNFICWKWTGADPGRQFPAQAVNVLHAMLTRHYHAPFRLVCITDDATGIDGVVTIVPLPSTKADHVLVPAQYKNFPSCFRRLWLFSQEATMLGPRICNIDLDVIITGDITAMLTSKTASFVGWCSTRYAWNKVAGGFWLLTTGAHTDVWDTFDPETSPPLTWAQGHRGSDQAWLSHCLWPPTQTFGMQDGLRKMNWMPKSGQPPGPEVRMVFTTGLSPPWSTKAQLGHAWITHHWHL